MNVMIAGGGTGGHVFPALAVAAELRRRRNEVVFVGVEQGIETKVVPAAGLTLRTLPGAGFKGVSAAGKLRSLSLLPWSLWGSVQLLREFRPAVVFGVGGYASGPATLAAALGGWPTGLFEPDAAPGLTNRLLAPLVTRAAVTYEETAYRFGAKAVPPAPPQKPRPPLGPKGGPPGRPGGQRFSARPPKEPRAALYAPHLRRQPR